MGGFVLGSCYGLLCRLLEVICVLWVWGFSINLLTPDLDSGEKGFEAGDIVVKGIEQQHDIDINQSHINNPVPNQHISDNQALPWTCNARPRNTAPSQIELSTAYGFWPGARTLLCKRAM